MLIDFRVEQEDSVYPMVPAGADLHAMIRRPSAIVETGSDAAVNDRPRRHRDMQKTQTEDSRSRTQGSWPLRSSVSP